MSLPARRQGRLHEESPDVAVVMMDGGRKVGCFLSMTSKDSDQDSCPNIPCEFAQASAVREIAKIAEKADVIHVVSYVWSAAQATEQGGLDSSIVELAREFVV